MFKTQKVYCCLPCFWNQCPFLMLCHSRWLGSSGEDFSDMECGYTVCVSFFAYTNTPVMKRDGLIACWAVPSSGKLTPTPMPSSCLSDCTYSFHCRGVHALCKWLCFVFLSNTHQGSVSTLWCLTPLYTGIKGLAAPDPSQFLPTTSESCWSADLCIS